MKKHIVVIGGGMAGTAAAHQLLKFGYDVTIIEKNSYIGGRIHTKNMNGVPVEMGAAFMTDLYSNIRVFLQESNLDGEIYQQRVQNGIVRNGKVRMATFKTLAGNSALTWKAKLDALRLIADTMPHWMHLDHHAFWKGAKHDERSVYDVFNGSSEEMLDYVLQPILGGYFYWDPKHVSYEMLRGLCKAALMQGKMRNLEAGLQHIPEAAAKGSKVLLNTAVSDVKRNKNGKYFVTISGDVQKYQMIKADGIVCATTASVVPKIISDLTSSQRVFFEAVKYSSTVVLGQVFPATEVRENRAIAFPFKENSGISAITSTSTRKKGGFVDVKIYASGTDGANLCKETDRVVIDTLTGNIAAAYNAIFVNKSKLTDSYVQRWYEALPYFDVGHLQRLEYFKKGHIEESTKALVFAGDYLGGPFMEGAFTSGTEAANRLDMKLND